MTNQWKLFPTIWRDGHKPLIKWGEDSSYTPHVHEDWIKGIPVNFTEWALDGIDNGSIKPEDIYLCVA